MGLLDFFMGIQNPVEGEYRIIRATKVSTSSSVANCDMLGELSGPGIQPCVLEHNSPFTSITRWPRPGDVLPVLFDRDNPGFLKVLWKRIPERE
jgi:hypothetical protein